MRLNFRTSWISLAACAALAPSALAQTDDPGRDIVVRAITGLVAEQKLDLVVANAENAAGGSPWLLRGTNTLTIFAGGGFGRGGGGGRACGARAPIATAFAESRARALRHAGARGSARRSSRGHACAGGGGQYRLPDR